MTVLNATLDQLITARVAVGKLDLMLVPFGQGNPAASVSLGRFTAAEMNTGVTNVIQDLLPFAVGTTVVGLAVTGTLTCAASATSQLTATATVAALTTSNVSATAVWTTSDATKATVSAAGLVTGVAAGTASITATYSGFSVTKTFTVTA